MNNEELLNIYGFATKAGLHNTLRKKCSCGEEMDINVANCPACGTHLPKSILLNVNKNSALAKRYETSVVDSVYTFQYFQLLSNGFELYEVEVLTFSIDAKTNEVKISNSKVFKSMGMNVEFEKFLSDNFPGFHEYVQKALSEFRFEYAISNFNSMSESQISNYFNVYWNYRALIPYLRGYKIFYYGNKVNLMKYFPTVDFNSEASVNRIGLCKELLLMWDIKNEKYVETIIEISRNSFEILETLENMVYSLILAAKRSDYAIDYNNLTNTFSLLYNKEISLEDFLRIYQNSSEDSFCMLSEFKQNYTKFVSRKIDWSTIEKLDRENLGTLDCKQSMMKEMKLSKQKVDEIYTVFESNPLEALKMMESK